MNDFLVVRETRQMCKTKYLSIGNYKATYTMLFIKIVFFSIRLALLSANENLRFLKNLFKFVIQISHFLFNNLCAYFHHFISAGDSLIQHGKLAYY